MRITTYSIAIAVLSAALLHGCVEQSTRMTEADRRELARYRTTTAPHPQHALAVNFENKVHLLGYDVSTERATPGQPFTVTWYFRVEHELGSGWRQFTHLATGTGENRINQDASGWVRSHYAPSDWKPGDYIRDEQSITVPEDWNSPAAKLFIGFWSDARRLRITSGPNDSSDRVPALTIPVNARSASGATPTVPVTAVTATKAASPITIDGELNEPAWANAVRTGAFVETMNGSPAAFHANGMITWDADNLYVAFEVADDFLRSSFTHHDDHLWEQDTVEVMVDPGADGQNYFEIQVAPTGQVFETRYDTRRQPQPFGHMDWTSNVRQRVALRGHVNDDDDDQGYTVEMALPFSAFATGTPPAAVPTSGTTWGINLYVMDARDDDEAMRYAAWSPPRVGDFHATQRFARVTFNDPSAPAVVPAPQAAAPAVVAPPGAVPAVNGEAPAPRLPVVPRGVAAQIIQRQLSGANNPRLQGQAGSGVRNASENAPQ